MEDVNQTCMLSSRWRPLCTTLPYLNFISKSTDYVNKTLLCHNPSVNIHTIKIANTITSPTSFSTWIRFVVLRGVQIVYFHLAFVRPEYYIGIKAFNNIKVPQCLFTCKSLVALKLNLTLHPYSCYEGEHVLFVDDLPTSVDLPGLKTLYLEGFCFNGSQFIQKFFTGSPVLENLSIINCGIKTTSLAIYATQLKYLEIDGIYVCIRCCVRFKYYRFDDDFCLDQHFKNCKITISVPLLTAFKCRGQISDEYLLHDLSSLARADIDMGVPKHGCGCLEKELVFTSSQKEEFGKNMMKFIGGLHNATSLTLGASLLEVLGRAIGSSLPTSYSARYLNITTLLIRDRMLATCHLLENSCNMEKLSVEITEMPTDSTMMGEHSNSELPMSTGLISSDLLRFGTSKDLRMNLNFLRYC